MRASTIAEMEAARLGRPRQPGRPTLIPAGFLGPIAFEGLADLARELQARAGGRDLTFTPCFAAYPGWDTFAALAIDAVAGDVAEYLGTAAIQGQSAHDLVAAFPMARAA